MSHLAGLAKPGLHKGLGPQAPLFLGGIPGAHLRGIDAVEPHPLAQHQGEAQIEIQVQGVAIDHGHQGLDPYT